MHTRDSRLERPGERVAVPSVDAHSISPTDFFLSRLFASSAFDSGVQRLQRAVFSMRRPFFAGDERTESERGISPHIESRYSADLLSLHPSHSLPLFSPTHMLPASGQDSACDSHIHTHIDRVSHATRQRRQAWERKGVRGKASHLPTTRSECQGVAHRLVHSFLPSCLLLADQESVTRETLKLSFEEQEAIAHITCLVPRLTPSSSSPN